MNITESELIDALRAAIESQPENLEGAYTTQDLCKLLNRSTATVRPMLAALIAKGEAECVSVSRVGIDNRARRQPAYRFLLGRPA